jgi:hypothetical protein
MRPTFVVTADRTLRLDDLHLGQAGEFGGAVDAVQHEQPFHPEIDCIPEVGAQRKRASETCPLGLRVAALFCAILRGGGKITTLLSNDFKYLMADPARFKVTPPAFGGQRSGWSVAIRLHDVPTVLREMRK